MASTNLSNEDKEEIISEVFFILWKNKHKLDIKFDETYNLSNMKSKEGKIDIMDL